MQLAIFAAASAAMASPASDMAALLGSLLWLVLAAPIFAAGGRCLLDGMVRAGAVIDAGIVVLVVLAASGGAVGPLAAVKIYLLWCAVALTECAVTQQAAAPRKRFILGIVAATAVLITAAGPFWTNAIVQSAEGPWANRMALAVTASNPVYATVATVPQAKFVWNEMPILYELTVLGRDVAIRTCPWYATAIGYAVVALLLMLRAHVGRRRRLT